MNAVTQQYPKLSATVAAIRMFYNVPHQVFWVGKHKNEAGENQGSLAILGFAKLNGLNKEQVLSLFGEAAKEVQDTPDGANHRNIRAFLRHGLSEVVYGGVGVHPHPKFSFIDLAWEKRAEFSPTNAPRDVRDAVLSILKELDEGTLRVSAKIGGDWFVNQSVKKAVLLSFRLSNNKVMNDTDGRWGSKGNPVYFDKVPLKFNGWHPQSYPEAGLRIVPGAVVRSGSFIGKNVVVMPSFINIGAYVDEGTMVDTWATVGSCAQIGKNCHLSGGVGIGGVLEPLQANPTIIEDNCFIGARSEVVEGVIVEEGSVLGMGCFVGKSTPIVNRKTGEVTYGRIPPYSVVVPGTMQMDSALAGLQKYCVVIMKTVDAQTRNKTALNDLLRD